MEIGRAGRLAVVALLLIPLAACGRGGGERGLFGLQRQQAEANPEDIRDRARGTTLSELFRNSANPNITVNVNKYLWRASLDVLNFLPIEAVDPFTGVIVTGYGTPPGGGRAYRATVYVQDPALDARSLRVALQVRGGGAVGRETARAVEDAILTRARQLRRQDSRL
ncbi:MAG: DUF3576 domain-containing protein [Gemmobacter sp.]